MATNIFELIVLTAFGSYFGSLIGLPILLYVVYGVGFLFFGGHKQRTYWDAAAVNTIWKVNFAIWYFVCGVAVLGVVAMGFDSWALTSACCLLVGVVLGRATSKYFLARRQLK